MEAAADQPPGIFIEKNAEQVQTQFGREGSRPKKSEMM
jgi:hypothetical protein